MEITQINRRDLHRIQPLWEELNALHGRRSTHFTDHFESFTFDRRIAKLLDKEHLTVFAAQVDAEIAGYCIATAEHEYGELDSLFIDKAYRGTGLGTRLSRLALEWLQGLGCTDVRVAVAVGNETAIPFYEKLGFQKRFTILRLK